MRREREYDASQGAYVDKSEPPDPFWSALHAEFHRANPDVPRHPDPLDTAEGQAEADRQTMIEAEATARRYGGHCKVCGVLRDYHTFTKLDRFPVHEFTR